MKRFQAQWNDQIGTLSESFCRKVARGDLGLNESVHFEHNGHGILPDGREFLAHVEFTAIVTIIREVSSTDVRALHDRNQRELLG